MREGWKKVRLKEISTKIGDGLHGTPKYDDFGEYFFINGNNLENGKILIKKDTKRINFDEFEKIKKDLSDRTILVAINGTLGNLGFYKGQPIALGKSACYINLNTSVSKEYVRYVLEFEHFQRYAYLFATGSTIKNLGLKAVREYAFNLPPPPTQRKIAGILSAYDDLIENNLKRIKLLEEKAQLMYEEWFVRLRFPGHETNPINPETDLPVGWEKVKLGEVASFKYGKMLNRNDFIGKGFPVYSGYRVTGYYNQYMFKEPTLIVVARGVGGTGDVKISPPKCWLTNLSIAVLANQNVKQNYLYYLLKDMKLRYLDSGAAQSQITIGSLENLQIVCASKDHQNAFDEQIKVFFESITSVQKQNQLLKEARDILLPRLMTGMIDVVDLKIDEFEDLKIN